MKIAIYCNNLVQLDFFLRFTTVFLERGWQIIFLSNRLSVILKARRSGEEAFLLCGYGKGGPSVSVDDYEFTFEVRQNILSSKKARRLAARVEAAALSFCHKYMPDQLWLWNGCNLVRQTLVSVAQKHGIKPLFFEVGNFPGKLFVDPEGVNCRSRYARHRQGLKKNPMPLTLSAFHLWKASYLDSKRKKHTVPQAVMSVNFNLGFAYDLIGFWMLGAITSEPSRPFWKTVDFVQRRLLKLPLESFDPARNSGYVFFPLQVSTDSQVLWNSDISQADALKKAADSARNEGRVLVVKPHPAEPHWSALREILKFKNEFNFKLVDGNTFSLMQHCSRVITLNSTVGLEAMLLDKPVEIFGRSHYAGFNEVDLAIYIMDFLLDIDFFSNAPISESQLESILTRVNF